MIIQITAATHLGNIRENNQDSIAFSGFLLNSDNSGVVQDTIDVSTSTKVCVLADGLGGHGGGDEASKFAVEQIVKMESGLNTTANVIEIIENVHKEICWKNRTGSGARTMGTTICGITMSSDTWFWFNVGDSRVYALKDGNLDQLSIDDAPGKERSGHTSSWITQCLGGTDRLPSINVHVGVIDNHTHSRLLLASDGLTSFVEHSEIMEVVRDFTLELATEKLVELAIAAGGSDNISVALIEVQ
jgi:PPM family protein phosphatase